MEELVIRPPRKDEGERLREIAVAAKAHWGYDEEWVRGWASRGDFSPAALVSRPFVVADLGGRAIGFATLIPTGDVCVLDDLWIEPDWIGCGIGSRLFRAAVEQARQLGATRLEWEAEPNAVGFYRRMGGCYLRESAPTELGRTIPVMGLELD